MDIITSFGLCEFVHMPFDLKAKRHEERVLNG
uniref:KH domaincontaining, RNAbinding, signal transductionassociated protein 2-like [Maylandia zebra] n=1 Tax=Lepeophtheirus salmonis TaxID=72036 RepID=A0A0K2TWD0_LEPSM